MNNTHDTRPPKPHETREGIRGLRDAPELLRIARKYPHGLPDRDANDRVLRDVVAAFQRALATVGIPLRLRLEPAAFDANGSAGARTRITILDGDCQWSLAIQNLDRALMIGERLCVVRDRADAVERMSDILLNEIGRVLGLTEGEAND